MKLAETEVLALASKIGVRIWIGSNYIYHFTLENPNQFREELSKLTDEQRG